MKYSWSAVLSQAAKKDLNSGNYFLTVPKGSNLEEDKSEERKISSTCPLDKATVSRLRVKVF
jgi:hypothetical protein